MRARRYFTKEPFCVSFSFKDSTVEENDSFPNNGRIFVVSHLLGRSESTNEWSAVLRIETDTRVLVIVVSLKNIRGKALRLKISVGGVDLIPATFVLIPPVVTVVVVGLELLKMVRSVSTWSRSYPLKFG